MKIINRVQFILFFFIFVFLFVNKVLALNLEKSQKLYYRDTLEYYIDENKENSVNYFYEIKINPVSETSFYDFHFSLKNVVIPVEIDEDTRNIIRIFTNGFGVDFTLDENLNFIYSPNIEYSYKNHPLYQKYKDRIDDAKFMDFAKSMFYNFFDWFGKLRKNGNIDFIRYFIFVNYEVYYQEPKFRELDLSRKKYKTNLYRATGRITKIKSNANIFDILDLEEGKLDSYEYFEIYTNLPLLLQRQINIKFSISNPKFRENYIKKYGKDKLDYKIIRTLMLIYSD